MAARGSAGLSLICHLASIAFASVLVSVDAVGQEDPEDLREYRAYVGALDAGDRVAAERHGRAAWQAAEKTLGDNRLTAVLAYNYGQLTIISNVEDARAALQRARELQEDGVADLPASELHLFHAYAVFASDGYKRRHANELRKSLEKIEAEGVGASHFLATMWLELARADLSAEQYRKARRSAAKAEAALLAAAPDHHRVIAEAILLRGVARLVPYPRTVDDVQAAHLHFGRARGLFSPQKDLDSFDPLLAQVLAWDGAAGAALRSLGREDYPDHEHSDADSVEGVPPLFLREPEEEDRCEQPTDWLARDAPRYPRSALREGYIGAVIVGYHLGDDLTVHDARVLAEVPSKAFSETALESMRDWRLKNSPATEPICRRNLTTQFTFVIDN